METNAETVTQENSRIEYKKKISKFTEELRDFAISACTGSDFAEHLCEFSTDDLYRIANDLDAIFSGEDGL